MGNRSLTGMWFMTFAAMALAMPVTAGAAISANFTDGNGTASPDQWTGVAGGGWATAWGAAQTDLTTTGVVTTTPLHGGGNYLSVVKAADQTQPYIRRQLDINAGVDLSQPHQVSLSFRYDADLSTFTAFSDRIAIFGDTSAQTGSSSTNTWLIGVVGSNTGAGAGQSAHPGNWYFIDNNGNTNFATSNMHDTGLALVEDRTYAIVVNVDPSTGTYAASIDDGVNPIVSATNLTFRRGNAVVTAPWFHVVANSGTSDAAAFSIDNITVVPEPASVGLLAIGALGLLARRRRG